MIYKYPIIDEDFKSGSVIYSN